MRYQCFIVKRDTRIYAERSRSIPLWVTRDRCWATFSPPPLIQGGFFQEKGASPERNTGKAR